MQRVRVTRWEVPQVTLFQVVNKTTPFWIQSSHLVERSVRGSTHSNLCHLTRTRPASTYAHSASVCQCNSRMTPSSNLMLTPASSRLVGNSRTVVCRVQPPSYNTVRPQAKEMDAVQSHTSIRTWESAKLQRIFAILPWSVLGGRTKSGFWRSRSLFLGP